MLFFLQLAVILCATRIFSIFGRRLGQPQVVSEMITGVILGPSVFGLLLPVVYAWLFPWDASQRLRDTQSYLFPISQLGLSLYMFIVGLEFRVDIVRQHLKSSLAVSCAGMLAPFALGATLGLLLYRTTALFPSTVTQSQAAIFLGASMCVTAFPMLARIIHFKKLTGTPMGTIALGAGAIDDAAAWCLLALVLANIDGHWSTSYRTIIGGLAYLAFAVYVVGPVLVRVERKLCIGGRISDGGITILLAVMSLGAWFTDLVGLHAVFGAFIVGIVVPRRVLAPDFSRRMEPLVVALLLPLFFTYSGLNTRITLLNSPLLWLACGLIVFVAIVGKAGGAWIAARLAGMPKREAFGVAILMNSRGLMELIIINIGLQRGIITYSLFAALVIMAIISTFMTSPLFERCVLRFRPEEGDSNTGSEVAVKVA